MSGRIGEVVETLERRKVDVCCAQETRWRGGSLEKTVDTNYFGPVTVQDTVELVFLLQKNGLTRCSQLRDVTAD